MPKASVSWQTVEVPQTPLHRGAFLNACVEWLVGAPTADDEEERLLPRTATACAPPRAAGGGVGTTRAALRLATQTCVVCGQSDGRAVVGNPFAGQPWVCVCAACSE
jgi:hypothetical protein